MNELNNEQHEYSTSAVEVEKKIKKAKTTVTVVTLLIVALVTFGYFFYQWKLESQIDYIEGNVLKVARTGTPSTGSVWKSDSFVTQLTWETLFGTDATFTDVNPILAEKDIEVSSDGLTYTIVLKDNLFWSDGTPLTMDDVVFSIETALLCSGTHNIHSIPMQQILGVEQWCEIGVESWKNGGTHSLEGLSVNGNTLTITMANAYSSFPIALTQFAIMPKHALEHIDPSILIGSEEYSEFTANPVCSGMYMVDCINEDGDLELIHNPYYYGEHSDIERVIMYGEFKNMYIDYYTTSDITEMTSYRNTAGVEEYLIDVLFYRYFVFNLMGGYDDVPRVPQLDDNGDVVLDSNGDVVTIADHGDEREENYPMQNYLLRQAISKAIDRETIASDIYLGNARHNFNRTGDAQYVEFLTDYDLEEAKALLIESGYDLERPIKINYYHTDANTSALLAKVKGALESIGLTVEVFKASGNVNMYDVREYDILLKGYAAQTPLEWYIEYLTATTYVKELVGTDEFDDLMLQLEGTVDNEEYARIFAQMQELDRNTMYRVPIVTTNDAAYIDANRISVPDDMVFGNTRYRSDLRLDEWFVKKG